MEWNAWVNFLVRCAIRLGERTLISTGKVPGLEVGQRRFAGRQAARRKFRRHARNRAKRALTGRTPARSPGGSVSRGGGLDTEPQCRYMSAHRRYLQVSCPLCWKGLPSWPRRPFGTRRPRILLPVHHRHRSSPQRSQSPINQRRHRDK
jgi:hypothetical protein